MNDSNVLWEAPRSSLHVRVHTVQDNSTAARCSCSPASHCWSPWSCRSGGLDAACRRPTKSLKTFYGTPVIIYWPTPMLLLLHARFRLTSLKCVDAVEWRIGEWEPCTRSEDTGLNENQGIRRRKISCVMVIHDGIKLEVSVFIEMQTLCFRPERFSAHGIFRSRSSSYQKHIWSNVHRLVESQTTKNW